MKERMYMGESKSTRSHNMNVFEKINHCFLYFEKIVLTFCTIVLVIAIFIQVVCRYILLISTPWAEELARYLFVWMAYLGGGYALHTGGQIEIDIAPTIIKSLKGISAATKDRIILLLKTVGLDAVGEKKTKHYSLGMKQRLGIALALVGEPDMLILDEPINGLDPQGIVEVRETIQKLAKERGMTICISSHILEELSKIATDYGIIHNGCLVQELTREELMKKCSERIELTLDNPKQAVPVLDDMGFSSYQVIDKEHIHIFERLGESARLNMELAKAGIPVKGISITSEELENYFLRLTGGDNRA